MENLRVRGITAFGLELLPRTISARKPSTRSSMANIAGYRAVVEAANFPRFFAGQFTMAGNVPPAKVLVVGAGVAAAVDCKNMGAIASLRRAAAAREQVESMGAEFLEAGTSHGCKTFCERLFDFTLYPLRIYCMPYRGTESAIIKKDTPRWWRDTMIPISR